MPNDNDWQGGGVSESESKIIHFSDPYEGEAVAIVRTGAHHVGIALSIKSDGDTQVFMPVPQAKEPAETILSAIESIKNSEQD